MAGKTIIMSIIKQILLLRTNGVTLKGIAVAVKISRNTVKKYYNTPLKSDQEVS
jgi:hypothetical protein